ncbi:Hypothetical predicted protein [Mytilus galloprovincialis]|uniref:Novel STAND NTPase 3 domain-containing protein n=1 Tax=Mytilus galloprovincialis TaxID=29158 RepID=A0A8B6HRU0_MYTGA|nr:Hypothetical predicted protein [Mytilus galloprovincialis]
MAPLLEEEENYIRLALLLKGVSPRAVRTFFDKEFPPTYLPSTLNKNYNTLNGLFKNRILNRAQWNLLFPKSEHSIVIENLSDLQDSQSTLQTEHSIVIENLRDLNDSHSTLQTEQSSTIDTLSDLQDSQRTLQTEHSIVTEILKDLKDSHSTLQTEHSSTTDTLSDLQDSQRTFKTEHSIVTEILRDLKDSNSILQIEHSKVTEILKDPIPWNIREQITEVLESWKEDDKTFIETNGAKSILKCIKENGCVVVTASSGTGKTSLVRHVALQMQNEGYEILPVSNPKEIIKWYNPSKNTLFVVDDFCGTYGLNPMKFDKWKNFMEKIKALVEKKPVKVIISCRLQVYKDRHMKSLSFFQECECNLQSADLCLLKTEKQCIAEFYLKTNASEISDLYDMFDCFPLLCYLYSKNSKLNIIDFFTNPFIVYKDEIGKLQTEGAHVKYCALALCVMFNNQLKEEWLTEHVGENIKTIIKNTYEACKVVKGTSRLVLRDELDSLTHTYIRKDGEVYSTIHDKLFDFLAFYFGSEMIYCLINNATSQFISERFLFERKKKKDELTIIVPTRYQQMYISRMVNDWSRGKVVDVFCNINMDDCIFRQQLLFHIEGLAISQQQKMASLYDIDNKSTPLIQCCCIGDINLVKWCLHNCTKNVNHCRYTDKVSPLYMASAYGYNEVVKLLVNNKGDINKCDYKDLSPLYIACQNARTEVVQMLINNKADINKCTDEEVSPIYVACYKGHTEVVQMLINSNADINKCKDTGSSPLYIACQEGHTKVVEMLINNKADINKCRDTGASPLYIACWKGNNVTVQMLINNKADINKCKDTDGVSPLYIACEEGHSEVVQMLIDNKADINKCSDIDGVSPLYIACQEGHTEVVQMLINNTADINKCRDTGQSSLYIACEEGHTAVVQTLINNKADINKCGDTDGVSPLYIACQKGHAEVVQMLIDNKAKINKCKDTGESPLYIACQERHAEVIKILINNKADINKCRDTGESPLYIACEQGHTEVVKILINNKVDINKCRDAGESPLYITCQEGHTEVVQMLIKNKADINKCRNTDGVSPLYIACQEGHTEVVQMLINNKADINKRIDTGEFPLFIACYKGHAEIVESLLKYKADCYLKCDGLTPLGIARRANHSNIVDLLERWDKQSI